MGTEQTSLPGQKREVDGVLSIAAEAVSELLIRFKAEEAVSTLESRLDSHEKFLSLVSHDLRTPLMTARMSAQLISRDPTQGDLGLRLSARIIEAIDRADRMIGDLLDANRLGAGLKLPILKEEIDLVQLVQTTIEDLAFIHKGRCTLVSSVPVTAHVDPVAIRRAIENLVNNAMKYGERNGPVRVSVGLEGERAKLSVHNRGNPISPEDLARLFRWYGRTDAGQANGAGWGLGLMLVKGIAEAHGGEVRVMSSAAQGTTFTLGLPLNS